MAVIWILEKPRKDSDGMVLGLVGSFPVRAFASVKSFMRMGCMANCSPDLILVSLEDFGDDWVNLFHLCSLQWPKSKFYFASRTKISFIDVPSHLVIEYQGATSLCFFIHALVSDKVDKRNFLHVGDIELDSEIPRIRVGGSEKWLEITHKEALLLKYFLQRPDKILSHEDICDLVWPGVKVSQKNISSHISRLRRYLLDSNVQIHNVYGGGYQLSLISDR